MKLQKIMIDGGFSCPNRDGTKGRGGCTFCRCDSFVPQYCREATSISAQVETGKHFFAGKYPDMKFLAYFQAYSGTYAPIAVLRERYEEALAHEDVVGLVIATRPDCVTTEVLSLLSAIRQGGHQVELELGCESFYDRTLKLVNRCHTVQDSIAALQLCQEWNFCPTVHLMLGLPGESREDILAETDIINSLPISRLKLHQLQILRDTAMARLWQEQPELFLHFSLQSYSQLVADLLHRLRQGIRIERYASSSPPDLLLHPRFGVKPSDVERSIKRNYHKL